MRNLVISSLVVFILAWPDAVDAAEKAKVVVHGDISSPLKPRAFADTANLGIGGGVGLALPLTQQFMILAGVDYTTFGLDDDGFREQNGLPAGSILVGGETSTLYASLGLRISAPLPGIPIRPYLVGGVGYFRIDPDDVTSDGTTLGFATEETTGIHGGGGFDLSFGSYLSIFFDALVIVGFTDVDATGYFPLRAGIIFDIAPDA
ncbi:MAG: autotransporter outer membrane beta-barrel domain-containing protein [Candidatus Krumholzibacteria bacterium]|nr:autotransporter outer membrane beta-barrel domain-containing protein [Candidatus Krumholzibacteria bacterium]